MGINCLMIGVGLIICFGGIYFRKICAGILGSIWGALLGVLLMLFATLSSGSLWLSGFDLNDGASLLIIVLFSVAVGALSIWLDKLCAAINTFLSSFFVFFMLVCMFIEELEMLFPFLALSFLLAGSLALGAYLYYNYAFILVTAFSGGYIASIAGVGLTRRIEFSQVLKYVFFDDGSGIGIMVMISTLVLGSLGCYVQLNRSKIVTSINIYDVVDTNSMNLRTDAIDFFKSMFSKILNSETFLEVASEKICLIICLLGFVIFPLANDLMLDGITGVLINKLYYISQASAFAGLIYLAYNKKLKCSIVYCIIYAICTLIVDGTWMQYAIGVAVMRILKPFILVFVSYILKTIMQTDCKYWISVVCFVFYDYFLLRWISLGEVYWSMSRSDILPIIAFIILLTVLVYVRCEKNLFDITPFINQKLGRIVTNNKFVSYIVAVGVVMLVIVVIFIKNIQNEEFFRDSAAGRYVESVHENGQKAEVNELVSVLTKEPWYVTEVYDCFTGESVYIGYVYGEMTIRSQANYLTFNEDGTFCFCLGALTADYENGEMTGIYESVDNKITLYADSSYATIEMEYTDWDYNGIQGMALSWIDMSDVVDEYHVYMIQSSFFDN